MLLIIKLKKHLNKKICNIVMELAVSKKVLLQDGDINKESDELIFDPYNERNKEISIHQIQNIFKSYCMPKFYGHICTRIFKYSGHLVSQNLYLTLNQQACIK